MPLAPKDLEVGWEVSQRKWKGESRSRGSLVSGSGLPPLWPRLKLGCADVNQVKMERYRSLLMSNDGTVHVNSGCAYRNESTNIPVPCT